MAEHLSELLASTPEQLNRYLETLSLDELHKISAKIIKGFNSKEIPPSLSDLTKGFGIEGELNAAARKAAWKKASLRFHPDRLASAPPALQAKYQELFKIYNSLNDVLVTKL
ncbi:MAG: hypothetical protein Q8O95_03260 [bacterium]|nr:hypothetical protein [bacterium]